MAISVNLSTGIATVARMFGNWYSPDMKPKRTREQARITGQKQTYLWEYAVATNKDRPSVTVMYWVDTGDESGLLQGPWLIEAFLTVQESGPVIGELSIRPYRTGVVPPGGLTKTFINSIPIGEIQSTLRTIKKALPFNIHEY